ncbi:MAG: DUF4249 family protein [Candidatus Marinimicrobia bacterium]|nr:DUF4249 family protein [Candidatus Neomarinimicrobiota bacterium]
MTKQSNLDAHHKILKVRLAGLLLIFLFITSCGNWGWEAIDTDNDEKLNVFGLISLDDSVSSFVIVHKTLDTAGPDAEIVGYDTIYYESWEWYNEDTGMFQRDTFWYDPPEIRSLSESLYIVKDADVTISDGSQSYSFIRSPQDRSGENYWYRDIFSDSALYLNTDGSFTPLPNTEYTLTVTTPGGHNLTGSLMTPALPRIRSSELADTVSINSLFDVTWSYDGDFNTTITTGIASQDWERQVCGINQFGLMEPGDTTWTSSVDSWCLEVNQSEDMVSQMGIRLRYLDENYYRYFLSSDPELEAISNFLIGEGNIGTAYGVEGGFGVFGAMSADWDSRYATP